MTPPLPYQLYFGTFASGPTNLGDFSLGSQIMKYNEVMGPSRSTVTTSRSRMTMPIDINVFTFGGAQT